MDLDNIGNLIDKDGFMHIAQYLSTGMVLRCVAVCTNWSKVCSTDDLWIIIFRSELKGEPRLSVRKNIQLNERIIHIWKKEFTEEHGNNSVKDIYINMRRKGIKSHNMCNPGYMNRMRIFPISLRVIQFSKEDVEKQKIISSMIGLISSDYLY